MEARWQANDGNNLETEWKHHGNMMTTPWQQHDGNNLETQRKHQGNTGETPWKHQGNNLETHGNIGNKNWFLIANIMYSEKVQKRMTEAFFGEVPGLTLLGNGNSCPATFVHVSLFFYQLNDETLTTFKNKLQGG